MQFKNFLSAALLGLLATGCNRVDFKKTKSGLPYKIYSDKKGATLRTGEVVKIHYTVKITNNGKDSVLQSTRTSGGPVYMPVNTSQSQPYDISEIVPMLRKGDSVVVVQAVDTFLRRSPAGAPPFFKKGGKLTTTLRIVDVYPSQEAARLDERKERENSFNTDKTIQAQLQKDAQTLQAFFQQNNIQATKTPAGAYIQMLTPGSGPHVQNGDLVNVYYTGRTMEGKAFDSNTDTSFHHTEPLMVRVGEGQMMRGFEDALLQMKAGDKARVYIPSSLAYGAQGIPQAGIGPNAILVFDVEPRSIQPKGGAQAVPPPPPAH
ncbi:FKBP-type peptidyl-prolyl cis-trans isomerase [Flaviaesturariibacter flavus]|nr:FKBP-type peptidyl-prolyl cis-trans isomerase [Flaviaesturariibacter flavus]